MGTVGVWACSDCGARNEQQGNCARCGEGPLLDARDPSIKDELWKSEEKAVRRRNGRLLPVVILVVSGVSMGAMGAYDSMLLLSMLFSPLGALILVGGLAAVSFVIWRAICRAFPPPRKFDWIGEVR